MKRLVFVMLNPSQAGWPANDPTVLKCIGFGRLLGMGKEIVDGGATFSECGKYRFRLWRIFETGARLDVVNMFGFISTNPKGLAAVMDPVGAANLRHVFEAVDAADMVIAAWGALPKRPAWLRTTGEQTLKWLAERTDVYALSTTAEGFPRHPLYLPYELRPTLYRARRAAA